MSTTTIPISQIDILAPPPSPMSLLNYNQSLQYNSNSPDSNTLTMNDEQINSLLQQGFTRGLAKSLTGTRLAFPLRIWIVDNSGSMNAHDGNLITIDTTTTSASALKRGNGNIKMKRCTRWDELRDCISHHIKMAALVKAPSRFRLLNNPGAHVGGIQEFTVATTTETTHYESNNIDDHINIHQEEVDRALAIMHQISPASCTPLAKHVREINQIVRAMTPSLVAAGQRVSIIIATDGLPTDDRGYSGNYPQHQFVESLRLLEGLPVWVVIRLCTDEREVVHFYNNLDQELELSLEVLDDFCGEAEEVYQHNSWLTYALPLHRCREMGYHDRVFDMIDERALTKGEMRDLCVLLFGQDRFDGVPDPAVDWQGFLRAIDSMLEQESLQWNPVRKKMTPWLNLKKLNKIYGDDSAGCSIM